jgi:hypothetical protein
VGTFAYIATQIVPPRLVDNTEIGPELPPPYLPEPGKLYAENESREAHDFAEPIVIRPSLKGLPQPRPPASTLHINPDVLTTQLEATENLKTPPVTVSFIVRLKELQRKQGELQQELSHGQGHRLDVYDTDQFAALAALHSGLKTIGTVLLDQDANAQLGLGLKTDVAVFLESVNAKDLTKVLGHLCPQGTRDAARLSNGSLVVSDLITDEQGKLLNLPVTVKTEIGAKRVAFAKSAQRTAAALAFEPSRLHELFLPPYSSVDSPGNTRALIILHARK